MKNGWWTDSYQVSSAFHLVYLFPPLPLFGLLRLTDILSSVSGMLNKLQGQPGSYDKKYEQLPNHGAIAAHTSQITVPIREDAGCGNICHRS